jgi:hypothetical protein
VRDSGAGDLTRHALAFLSTLAWTILASSSKYRLGGMTYESKQAEPDENHGAFHDLSKPVVTSDGDSTLKPIELRFFFSLSL